MIKKLKKAIFSLIEERETSNIWSSLVTVFIQLLIIFSVVAIIIESYESLNETYREQLQTFEVFVVIVFTLEYLLRLWTADLLYPELGPFYSRIKFIFSAFAIIDLLAILPFYVEWAQTHFAAMGWVVLDLRFIRILRLTRLLRILKLSRYSASLQLVNAVVRDKKEELFITIFMCFVLIILSSALMYNIEHEAQPEAFPDIISTFWWAIATLTTVGYGDVYPITGLGKLISGVIALLGIGLVALPTGILSGSFIEKINEAKTQEKQDAYKYCPHCGKPLH